MRLDVRAYVASVGCRIADLAAIRAVVQQEVDAANDGDPDAFIQTLTADVVVMPPNGPAVVGEDAREWLRGLMSAATIDLEEYRELELLVTGGRAYHVYGFRWTVTPTGGEPVVEQGKGIHLLRRDSDGSWRISHDVWNANAPQGM